MNIRQLAMNCIRCSCSTLLLLQLAACGGGGFATGPTTSETDADNSATLTNQFNDVEDKNPVNASVQFTPEFFPESGAMLTVDQNTVLITDIAGATTLCLSTNNVEPRIDNGMCLGEGVQQIDNPPNDLSIALVCSDINLDDTQIHSVKLALMDDLGNSLFAEADYTQNCNQDALTPLPGNELIGAIAIAHMDYTSLEEIPVNYAVSFAQQFSPNGETVGVFPDGGLNTSCDWSITPILSQPIQNATGQVLFPALSTGRYQLQLLDSTGCHLGAPLALNIVEPQITVHRLQEGENDYKGGQDTSIAKEGLRHEVPMGGDKEIEADGSDLEDGELVILLQWALPPEVSGVVREVHLGLQIIDPSGGVYGVYAMNAPWSQDTAIWDTVNLAVNQGQLLLGEIRPNNNGNMRVALNADGIALTQAWIDGQAENHGFIIRAINTTDGMQIDTSEERNKEKRPLLEISVAQ